MSPKVPNYLREVSLRFASPPETSSSSLPALVEPHPRRTPHRGGTLLRRPAARRLLVPLVHHAVPLAAVAPGDDRARVHPPKQRAPLPAAGIAAPYPLQRRRRVVRRADGRRHPPPTEDDEDVLRFPLTLDLPDRAMRDSYASLQCSRLTQTRRWRLTRLSAALSGVAELAAS
ncbi:hypothetical protein THAOC_26121 [Thalassiosira oceanica]|uniref:Uncharacterized protein n=1 Tax=Thalassiosira oceanica TaxID=159749 RepID=K0RMD4_THAOC|nr:hypothetical protein THAOC_26121 [Thalassiosira oceanica]|eukprot:EJK54270.1 hypothetical protein THAOC_26121 [Thalassiosira oceanica]